MRRRILGLPLLLATAVLFGCDGVGPAGPMMDLDDQLMGAQAKGGKKGQTTGTTADATMAETEASPEILTRIHPLPRDYTATAVIGEDGGWIGVQGGGLGLWVPAGALSQDVEITITALAGDKLAYDFQPHGLKFHTPVRIGILKGLGYNEAEAFGVYFEGDHKGNPKFLEFYTVWNWQGFTMLETTHFSGYALASGSRGQKTLSGASF